MSTPPTLCGGVVQRLETLDQSRLLRHRQAVFYGTETIVLITGFCHSNKPPLKMSQNKDS